MISIAILLIILGLIAVLITFKSKRKHEPDYYNFFIIGIIWTAFGIIFKEMSFFFIIGLVFLALGLVNKDKWKKNRKTWNKLTKSERKVRIWVITILGLLCLVGLVLFMYIKFVG